MYEEQEDEVTQVDLDNVESPSLDDELEIEVVDDTPPQDRGRKPAKNPIPDVTDDELEEYGEKVQERIRGLNRKFHDERRAKEATAREREELAQHAKRVLEENKRLKQQLASGSEIFIAKSVSEAEAQLDTARRELKEAHENGDSDKFVAAQEKISRAVTYLEEAKRLRPLTVEEEQEYIPHNKTSVPEPSTRAKDWASDNEWFGANQRMTALAHGIHYELVSSGVEPDSDDYYRQIDDGMRKAFPEYFGTQRTMKEDKPRSKPSVVVAPANRSHAPKKITLTKSQEAAARRLGVPLEEYARQVMLIEKGNH